MTPGTHSSEGPPTGVITATVVIEVPVEVIAMHWTKEEASRLVRGHELCQEAREECVSQALSRSDLWSGFDVLDAEIKMDGDR